ncbi:hypothetical protein ACS0TY_029582 [Phlomoides rotata]
MSAVYDNWEKLVAAVLRREQLWQLFHADSREPSINSESSEFSSSWSSPSISQGLTFGNSEVCDDAPRILASWEKQYKRGVYITLLALSNGTRFVKSQMEFEEQQKAVMWWFKNRGKIYKKYNAWGGNSQIRRPSVVTFSWSPLIEHQQPFPEPTPPHLLPDAAAIVDHSADIMNQEQTEDIVIAVDQDDNEENLTSLLAKWDDELGSNGEKSIQGVENSTQSSHISEIEKTALHKLKKLVREGLNRHGLNVLKPPDAVSIWGVKLLEDERSDVILLKFLWARYFEVNEAFTMINNTIKWRREFGVDQLVEEEDVGDTELERAVFMHGYSKEGYPVCYSDFGELINDELYQKTFSDEKKRQKFLRWRIQFFEKMTRNLDFRPGGISTIFQVHDLKSYPGSANQEFRLVMQQSIQLLEDNYPKLVTKQVFINVRMWFAAMITIIRPLLTQRSNFFFVMARPSKSLATLFKYIAAEQIPLKYRGLSQDGIITADSVTEIMVKPSPLHVYEFPVTQEGMVRWEVRVVGWESSFEVKFVPSCEDSYTFIFQRQRRVGSTQEEVIISNNCSLAEPGKLVLTMTSISS